MIAKIYLLLNLFAVLLLAVHVYADDTGITSNGVETKTISNFPLLWRGRDGRDGKDGKDGLNGRDGMPGPRGAAGASGPKGDKGIIGPQGPPGSPGQKGETGLQGPPGTKGAEGRQGPPGACKQLFCSTLAADICGECQCFDDAHNPNRYYCDCTHLSPQRDCLKHFQDGHIINGIYRLNLNGETVNAPCDMKTDHGGWTVFQQRVDESTNFYRNWVEYKNGFGSPTNNLWLGNKHIHSLSQQARPLLSEIRFDLETFDHIRKYASYDGSEVRGEDEKYRLKLGTYKGDAGDSMNGHNNNRHFTTYDSDNDDSSINCAVRYASGWWYGNCHYVHLNGVYYYPYQTNRPAADLEIDWNGIGGRKPLKFTSIMIRRKM